MTLHITRGAALIAALALVATTRAQPPLPPPDKVESKKDAADQLEPGVQVAEKGPIHEAFAQPGAETRGKGMTAPKAPPAPIPELPPETKPDGANVKWVSGYWQWDAEKQDFLWVSGFWRNFPAGRDWQAGKWAEKDGQWSYNPGFWRPTNMNSWRVDLPEPPKSVESGPSTPANEPNAIWIPGAWEYRNEQFVWRAGYWAHPNGNQVWQAGQYVQSGSGFTYVPGFWDYPLEDRGLLYAPVYFSEPLWQNPGWYYRPRFAFGLGLGYGWGSGGLFSSLFIGPGFNNYCYGNYYNPWGSAWGGWGGFGWGLGIGFGFGSAFGGWGGYYPWWGSCRGYSNQLWNHYCYLNRGNPNWATNVRTAGVTRAVAASPRPTTVVAHNTAPRATSVSPGLGGAVQTAALSAAHATTSQPLIQPASQVAKSLQATQATRASLNSTPNATAAVRNASGVEIRSGANQSLNANTGRSAPGSPPIHAGAVQMTPGGGNPGSAAAGQPTIRPGNGGGERLNPPTSLGNPTIRSSPQNLPQVRPTAPAIHPSAPSLPSRASPPVIRSSPGSFGGGRGVSFSPSAGRMGGFSGGGGGRMGGGGGGHGGGKR